MRLGTTAQTDYDLENCRLGKMERDNRFNDLRGEAKSMQTPLDFMKKVKEEFSVDFFDEKVCRMAVLKMIHKEGPRCPQCGKAITSEKGIANFYELKRVFCKHCKKIFTALTGTAFNGMQLDLRTLYLLAVFLALKIDRKEIARMLNIHTETVRLWDSKFKAFEGIEDMTVRSHSHDLQ